MRLSPFRLHRPTSVERASDLLLELGEAAALYCGGTELLLVAKLGFTNLTDLIDVKPIDELAGIDNNGGLRIGATTTHREIERSAAVDARWGSLAAMERAVGNLRVRNVGTLGGNLCFADPHSDPATYLTAADAQVRLRGNGPERKLPVEQFVLGPYTTALQAGELLISVEIPERPPASAIVHRKMAFQERPAITVAVSVQLAGGSIQQTRVVVGSIGLRATRATEAEEVLIGTEAGAVEDPGLDAIVAAAEAAAAASAPVADSNGSVEYKRQLVRVLTERCLRAAVAEAART